MGWNVTLASPLEFVTSLVEGVKIPGNPLELKVTVSPTIGLPDPSVITAVMVEIDPSFGIELGLAVTTIPDGPLLSTTKE